MPLIDPRGVLDYYNPTPAPATVARGGILQIGGTNLGPVTTVAASKTPLPTTLGSPAVQATLNGEAMPLFSVSAREVVAQVPWDAATGTANILVSVGGVTGPAGHVTIVAAQPSIRTADGSGTGLYAGTASKVAVTLAVSGLGATRPALTNGTLPPNAKYIPAAAIVGYIGGVRTTATATASIKNVGEFDVVVNIPPLARTGDLIYLVAGSRPSNAVVYQTLKAPVIQMMPLASGSPTIASLATPDVSGSFIIPYGAKDATGCTPALWFDMLSGHSGTLSPCLADPSRAALSPLVLPPDSEVAGGLVGPPDGAAPAGVSSNVLIANADDDSQMAVTLGSDASALTGTISATFLATIPGTPAQTDTINGLTGTVTTTIAGAGGGGAAAPATAPASVNVNGLTYIVTTPVQIAAGQYGLVAADDPVSPKQAAYALVQTDGTVLASRSFPAGWLPLIPAKPAATSPAVMESVRYDTTAKKVYLLVRAADASRDAFLTFPYDAASLGNATPGVTAMPAGWFATSCSGTIRLQAVSLYPASVLPGSRVAVTAYSNPCSAAGFLLLNLASGTVKAYSVGMDSQLNATTFDNFNDFIYGTDLNKSLADTVYVFDAAYSAVYTIAPPLGSPSFSGLQSLAGTNWLLAQLTTRTAGDGGFVLFDLAAETAKVFPLPAGYTSVQFLNTFPATNKIAIRGVAQGNFHLLLYDLAGNLTAVQNPAGVASFGPPPAATAAAAARLPLPVGNPKSNTVAALSYDASGNQTGVLLVQVP